MYIKKKDRELFKNIDDALVMPYDWKKFIAEKLIKNNLIIKMKTRYKCTNCNIVFEDQAKVNEYCKCPNCNNLYLVKSNRLKSYEFRDDLAILDKYEEYYIVREFRLITIFQDNKYSHYDFEYARVIYDKKFNPVQEIINENVVGNLGGWFIAYRKDVSSEWRYFNTWRTYLPDYFMYYPYNLEEMLSGIKELKYSMLWELVKYVNCNLIYLIKNYNPSIELLTKMKLYNLALCPKTFLNKKTFEDRFMGLTKDYLPFIQEYNLDIDELTILSRIKVKNINYLKKYKNLSSEHLDELSKKVNLKTLIDKTDFEGNMFFEYRDYLDIAKKLKLNLKDKTILYPKHIKTAHDKLTKQYEQVKNDLLNKAIKRKYKKLKGNIFENKKYIIFPAKDINSLIDESSQQNNCVRTYADRIAEGECEVYFMRLLKDIEHSLVTVEVKNNHVVQKRTKNNQVTTKAQDKFLKIWEQTILEKSEEVKN